MFIKIMIEKINKIERDVLYHLSTNSNVSLTKLSKKMGKSKQVLSYNIKKLIERGIILKFFPIIDYNLLGYTEFRILLRLNNSSDEQEQKIINFLKKQKNVKKILKVNNYFNLVFEVMENDISRLYELVFCLEQHFGRHFIEKDIDVVSKKEFLTYEMFKDKEKTGEKLSIIIYNEKKGMELDNRDLKILEEIEKNSWINYVELSSKVRMNPKTLIYRIKRLEKSDIIKGYSIYLDWKKLGMVHYRVLIDSYLSNKEEFEALIKKIRNNPDVVSIKTVISKYVLEFDMISKSYNEMAEFISNLKSNFPDTIKTTDLLYVEQEI